MTSVEVREKAEVLQQIYKDDLGKTFPNECVHFRAHILSLKKNEENSPRDRSGFVDFYKSE